VELSRIVTVDDSGTILNPLITEGQRHGGVAQGVAQALLEEFVYDADGNPVTSNLADYAMISACELPSIELVPMETPTPHNALGAKGIGESGTIGATPAVQNAVVDALAPLGVRHVDMPCTAERVWRAIQAGRAGVSGAAGPDFDQQLRRAAAPVVATTVDEPPEQVIDEAEGGYGKATAAEAVEEATGEGPGPGGPMPAV
jgi:hypothetical protein